MRWLWLVLLLGVIALIARWAFKSTAAMLACVFLLGSTDLGHFTSAFFVAPFVAGYISHDTTPWTETVIAGWTAAAAFAMVLAALDARRRKAPISVA